MQLPSYAFCHSLVQYKRFTTHEVSIGGVPLGGSHPIRVQSMTTADTMNTEATVDETIRLIEAGSEYVRITAPSIREAKNLSEIKRVLAERGYSVPLVADIHYTPNAAEVAARIVEKVRINPGNFVDKKRFDIIEYTDEQYNAEKEKIRDKFVPLVRICKEHGTAMRIGTNHGSLSDRIMSRWGDTPQGMVESAMEFLRIAQEQDYHNIVLSMKASNPQVMVEAYRLLTHTMLREGMTYPIHLGVTEAGDGEDGRIKSAVGIGTLLEDGIGDTIRVSLTEDPEHEIPVARLLADRYAGRADAARPILPYPDEGAVNLLEYTRRHGRAAGPFGAEIPPRVIASWQATPQDTAADLKPYGWHYLSATDKWAVSDSAADAVYFGASLPEFDLPPSLIRILDARAWSPEAGNTFPLFHSIDEYRSAGRRSAEANLVCATLGELAEAEMGEWAVADPTLVLVLHTDNAHAMAELRRAVFYLGERGCSAPVILRRSYAATLPADAFMIHSSVDTGGIFIDGMGDGIWLEQAGAEHRSARLAVDTAFGILQATRLRISRTEYIACPSCGRTLFNLQETTARIRARTAHLKGVKIGIMGCIVNGPGEMADADFGYVGSGPDRITLYRGKEIVKRNVPTDSAVDELIRLIKDHDMWAEPPSPVHE